VRKVTRANGGDRLNVLCDDSPRNYRENVHWFLLQIDRNKFLRTSIHQEGKPGTNNHAATVNTPRAGAKIATDVRRHALVHQTTVPSRRFKGCANGFFRFQVAFRHWSAQIRYGVTVALFGVAFELHVAWQEAGAYPSIVFLTYVFICAFFFGRWESLLATALSAGVLAYFLLYPGSAHQQEIMNACSALKTMAWELPPGSHRGCQPWSETDQLSDQSAAGKRRNLKPA
jgi:hypothetical protein